MKNLTTKQLSAIGTVFVSLAGSLDHFLYEWTGSAWVGLISPVNESVWEHLKIYLFPVLVFLVFEWLFIENKQRLLAAKLGQLAFGLPFLIIFFYSYTGALGIENVIIDILSFYLASGVGYFLSYRIITEGTKLRFSTAVYGSSIVLIVLCLWLTTFYPPQLPLFRDPVTSTYGIRLE